MQCQVRCHSHLGMSHDQTTGLCEPGAPAFEVHTLLPLVESEEHQQVTVFFTSSLGIWLLTGASVSRSVKWRIIIPIPPPDSWPRPLVKTWTGGHGEES